MTTRLGALAVLLVTVAACNTEGMAFRIDERVTILSPRDREAVTLPLTVRWEATDLDPDVSFGVYVDRAPARPGGQFVSSQLAFQTSDTELLVERVAGDRDRDRHTVTIVLLDEDGRRSGESAWEVAFDVEPVAGG